ncbi:MAG: hypothetical protein WCG27_06895 [Pseudomonadota bacterium]
MPKLFAKNLFCFLLMSAITSSAFAAITIQVKPEQSHLTDKVAQNFKDLRAEYILLTYEQKIRFQQALDTRAKANGKGPAQWSDLENALFKISSEKSGAEGRHVFQRTLG